jgi:tetratricopeptide (TPR) repeat protein
MYMKLTRLRSAFLALACAITAYAAGPAQSATDPVADFGRQFARVLNEHDRAGLTALFDFVAFGRRAAAISDGDAETRRATGDRLAVVASKNLAADNVSMFENGDGTAKFMRIVGTNPGRPQVRVAFAQGGFDYLELIVERRKSGRLQVVDWFQLSRGELLSETVGGADALVESTSPSLIERLFGEKDQRNVLNQRFARVSEAQVKGDFAGALAELEGLPGPLLNSRQMLFARARLAGAANLDTKYQATLELLAARYATDPAAAFVLADHYFYKKQTEKVIQSMTTVEKRVGADGMTSLAKASAHLDVGELDQAMSWAREAIRLEPDFSGPHDTIALIHVKRRNYAGAIEEYRVLEKNFGYVFGRDSFMPDERFADFVKSAEFRKWLPK